MTKKTIDWDIVERAAVGLGASRFAIDKWRQRQTVPHKWRALLVQATSGAVTWDHFTALDKASRRAA